MRWIGLLGGCALIAAVALWVGAGGGSRRALEVESAADPQPVSAEALDARAVPEHPSMELVVDDGFGAREVVESATATAVVAGAGRTRLTGTLLDFRGRAMPKAQLRFNDRWAGRRVETDAAGAFEVELTPGLDPREARAANPRRKHWVEGKQFAIDLSRSRFEPVEEGVIDACQRWKATLYAMAPAYCWSFELQDMEGQPARRANCELSVLAAAVEPGELDEWLFLVGHADADGRVEFELDGRHAIFDWLLLAQLEQSSLNDFLDVVRPPQAALMGPGDFYRAPEAQRVLGQVLPERMDVQLAKARTVRINVSSREDASRRGGQLIVRRDGRRLHATARWNRGGAARHLAVLPPGVYEVALEWPEGVLRRAVQVELATPQTVNVQRIGARNEPVRTLTYAFRQDVELDFGPELAELLGPMRGE